MKALLFLLVLVAPPASAATTLTTSKTYPARDVRSLEIVFPAGGLEISAADGDEITVTMTARCRGLGERCRGRCRERAERIRLVSETHGGTLSFKLEGMRKTFPDGLAVHLEFMVPRSLGLSVEMGAGDLDIGSLHGDVKVELGAGDVNIHLPEREVSTVELNVGVGDARIRLRDDSIDGSGFLSKRVHWSSGPGSSRVNVDLGVGDVDVALD